MIFFKKNSTIKKKAITFSEFQIIRLASVSMNMNSSVILDYKIHAMIQNPGKPASQVK